MVREIISISVGQCGNKIGHSFWSTLLEEHHLSKNGKKNLDNKKIDNHDNNAKLNVYFQEAKEDIETNSKDDTDRRTYVPRCVLIDTSTETLDSIKASSIGSLFKPDNFISANQNAANNWGKGHYTLGGELIDTIIDTLRKEIESCDCLQGFQMTHSIGGGTGSGLGTLLLTKIKDRYADRINCTYTIFPSEKVSDIVVEPYNAILSIAKMIENSDETFSINNESLYKILKDILRLNDPKYSDLNWIVSLAMSGITASLRFGGELNSDLRKLGVNLVPFHRLKFLTITQAPLYRAPDKYGKKNNMARLTTVRELVDQLWSPRNSVSGIKPEDGKYFCGSFMFRGNVSMCDIDDELYCVGGKMSDDFVFWIPNHFKSSKIEKACPATNEQRINMSGTFVANNTAIKVVFRNISNQFTKLIKKRANLHWYEAEGMDENEMVDASTCVKDLIAEYQDKQDYVYLEDDDESDGDDQQQETNDEF